MINYLFLIMHTNVTLSVILPHHQTKNLRDIFLQFIIRKHVSSYIENIDIPIEFVNYKILKKIYVSTIISIW